MRLSRLTLSCIVASGLAAVAAEQALVPAPTPPCHTQAEAKPAAYRRTTATYNVPDVAFVDRDGRRVSLPSLLDASRPVALNFIFTSCRTICPVMTATFGGLWKQLGEGERDVQMVSISINPEFDKPSVLQDYAERFDAAAAWHFLTGQRDSVVAVQKAFDAYAGSKSNHRALTFFRGRESDEWVRIEGLASASDLADELRRVMGPN